MARKMKRSIKRRLPKRRRQPGYTWGMIAILMVLVPTFLGQGVYSVLNEVMNDGLALGIGAVIAVLALVSFLNNLGRKIR